MQIPQYETNWPDSWKQSHRFDTMEFGSSKVNLGYTYAYHNRFNSIIKDIEKNTPASSVILDVAAAQGNFTLTLAEKGYNLIWNDFRSDLIDYVKLKHTKGDISYREGNIFNLNFDVKIDAIVITEIIEHVAHPDQFLIKIASLLEPGGYIYMSTPLGSYFLNKLPRYTDCINPSIFESVQFQPDSNGHIFLLHVDEIQDLADIANLKILSINICNNPLTSGHIKLGKLLPFIPKILINLVEKITQSLPFFISKKIHSSVSVVFKKI